MGAQFCILFVFRLYLLQMAAQCMSSVMVLFVCLFGGFVPYR